MNWQGNFGLLAGNSLISQNVLVGQEWLSEVHGFLVGWFVGQCQNVISIKRIDEKGKITDENCLHDTKTHSVPHREHSLLPLERPTS